MPNTEESVPLAMSWSGSTSEAEPATDDDLAFETPAFDARPPAARIARATGAPVAGDGLADDSVALHVLRTIRLPDVSARQLDQSGASLLDAYGALIKGLVRGCLDGSDEDAEEVLADAVLRFLQRCPADCAAPDLWLITVARRLAISRRRAQRSKQRRPAQGFASLGAPGDPGPLDDLHADAEKHDPINVLLQRERLRILQSVLPFVARSSKKRALALSLLMAGHSIAEIAVRMNASEGAIRDMLFRVREFIRDLLKDLKP